jgi:hypothetical protein
MQDKHDRRRHHLALPHGEEDGLGLLPGRSGRGGVDDEGARAG